MSTVDLSTVELPTRKQEEWKYTDLSRLVRQVDNPLSVPQPQAETAGELLRDSLTGDLEAHRLVFLDGIYQAELSDSEFVPEPARQLAPATTGPLDALSGLTRSASYSLQLQDSPARPLLLVQLHSRDRSVLSALQLQLRLDPGVRARIIEEQIGGRHGVGVVQQQLQLGVGAELRLLRLQHLGPGQFLLGEQNAELAERAHMHEVHVEWGGRLSRLQAHRVLGGRGARSDYFALSGLNGSQQVDHQLLVQHASPEAVSRLRARGIVGGSARQVFNGRVQVDRDAQHTDSDQLLRNLLLSDKAEVDAKPELRIYADDVRCAHGSTVGRLDDAALFYLRSRGIPEGEARRLLMLSFAARILGEIDEAELHHPVQTALATHLSLGEST